METDKKALAIESKSIADNIINTSTLIHIWILIMRER